MRKMRQYDTNLCVGNKRHFPADWGDDFAYSIVESLFGDRANIGHGVLEFVRSGVENRTILEAKWAGR